MTRFIAIEVEDSPMQVHAAATLGDYQTLCGLDGGLTDDTQRVVGLPIGARIDCRQCWALFQEAKQLRARDFCASLRS